MDLRAELDELSVPAIAYSIGRDLNEAYCLTQEVDGWHVFYSERGNRNAERIFSAQADAEAELKRRLLSDGAVVNSMRSRAEGANKPNR